MNNELNPVTVAKWLNETSEENFAETLVNYDRFSREKRKQHVLEAKDMCNFDLVAAIKHIGDRLDDIIFSKEVREGAWWKGRAVL